MEEHIEFVRLLILTILNSSVVGIIVSNIFTKHDKKAKQQSDMALALQCLLRYKLLELHKDFVNEGHVTTDEFSDFDKAYQVYHSLGGNGTVEKIYHEVQELKFSDDK